MLYPVELWVLDLVVAWRMSAVSGEYGRLSTLSGTHRSLTNQTITTNTICIQLVADGNPLGQQFLRYSANRAEFK
jgi:hypothetical protein